MVIDKPELVIIRGLPGSGKTTMAKREYPYHFLVEADMYFVEKGKYKYNPRLIKKAHEWCLQTTKILLNNGLNVVVCNTFTRKWEFEPYTNLEFPYKIIVAKGQYKNVHNVPDYIIENMRKRWED